MAYGTNAPFGLQPRMSNTGAPWNGQTNTYIIESGYGTNLFIGDPVAPLGNGSIGIGAAGTGIAGVFWGCQYQDPQGNFQFSPYWPANTVTYNPGGSGNIPATAFVVDDPSILFDIQVSSSIAPGAQPTVNLASLNANANFSVGGGAGGIVNPAGGSTVSGQSAYYLDASTITSGAPSAAFSLKIIRVTPGFTNQAGNIGTVAAPVAYTGGQNILGLLYNNVLVQINNDIYKGGTGTAGV